MSVDNGRWTMFELTVDSGILRGKCSKCTNKTPKKIKQSFWQNLKSKRKLSAPIFVLFFCCIQFCRPCRIRSMKTSDIDFQNWEQSFLKLYPNNMYIVRSLAPLHICIEHWALSIQAWELLHKKKRESESIIEFYIWCNKFRTHAHNTIPSLSLAQHNNGEKYVDTQQQLLSQLSNRTLNNEFMWINVKNQTTDIFIIANKLFLIAIILVSCALKILMYNFGLLCAESICR